MSFEWTQHLEEGEELYWQGRPDSRLVLFLSGLDYAYVPMLSILFISLALLMVGVLGGAPLPEGAAFAVFAFLPFFYFFPGRALLDRAKRRRLRYAITSRRVLRLDTRSRNLSERLIQPDLHIGVSGRRFKSIELDRYEPDAKVDVPRGVNLLVGYRFDGSAVGAAMNPATRMLFPHIEYGLELRRLTDGEEVAKLLRRLRDEAGPP